MTVRRSSGIKLKGTSLVATKLLDIQTNHIIPRHM